jgi:hypothetical protein
MTQEPSRERDPIPRFLGWALMAVGVLWVLASGACAISGLTGADAASVGTLLLVGSAVSALAGIGIFFLGRLLARN